LCGSLRFYRDDDRATCPAVSTQPASPRFAAIEEHTYGQEINAKAIAKRVDKAHFVLGWYFGEAHPGI
jgi:hypothetical protein